jgi:hypothetical protein
MQRGYLAMGGQVVDAAMVAAPKRRKTGPEKAAESKCVPTLSMWSRIKRRR